MVSSKTLLTFCALLRLTFPPGHDILQYQKKLLATHHTVEQYTSGVFSSLDSALKQLDFFKAQYDADPDYYGYQRKENATKEEWSATWKCRKHGVLIAEIYTIEAWFVL